MSKSITYKKLINHYFNASTLSWFSAEAHRLAKTVITLQFPYEEGCYMTQTHRGRPSVVLGKKFYNKAVINKPNTDEVDPKLLKKTYKDISAVYKGALYHEVSHKLYTDVLTFTSYIQELLKRGYPDLANLFKTISNIVEDVVIEDEFEFYYPSIGKFLQYLRLRIFSQETIDEFRDSMEDTDVNHLIQFILYKYRVPSRVAFEHKLYTDNKKALHSSMFLALNTVDAKRRLNRCLAFAYEFYMQFIDDTEKPIDIDDVLKGKDMAWIKSLPEQTHPKTKVKSPKSSPLDMDEESHGEGSGTLDPSAAPKGAGEDDEDEEELKDKLTSTDGGVARRETMGSSPLDSKPSSAPDPDSTKLSDAVVNNAANDEPVINQDHRSVYIHDSIDFAGYNDHYRSIVVEHEPKINKLVNIVKKMKAVNNNRYERHQKKGKLDKRKITKETDSLKVFKKRLAPRKEADLSFSLLVDNSGSMMGRKSIVVGNALVILQETLYRLGIPFEVNAFTENFGGEAVTIEMHRFDDSFNKTKASASLFTKQIEYSHPLYTFQGNVDESNLQFIGTRFLHNRKEKDKILIMMSDGATTGSRDVLSRVAQNFENKGMTILGIGIIDDNVEDIYNDHYTFSSIEDLENLAGVIQRYILNKVFK